MVYGHFLPLPMPVHSYEQTPLYQSHVHEPFATLGSSSNRPPPSHTQCARLSSHFTAWPVLPFSGLVLCQPIRLHRHPSPLGQAVVSKDPCTEVHLFPTSQPPMNSVHCVPMACMLLTLDPAWAKIHIFACGRPNHTG